MPALAQRAGTKNQLINYDFGQKHAKSRPLAFVFKRWFETPVSGLKFRFLVEMAEMAEIVEMATSICPFAGARYTEIS